MPHFHLTESLNLPERELSGEFRGVVVAGPALHLVELGGVGGGFWRRRGGVTRRLAPQPGDQIVQVHTWCKRETRVTDIRRVTKH